KAGYMYRISLPQAAGSADCLGGLVLNFGPALKLPYAPNKVADVFVITSGGLGSIGLKSAERFGEVVVFELTKPLCLDRGPHSALRARPRGRAGGGRGRRGCLWGCNPAALQRGRARAEPLRWRWESAVHPTDGMAGIECVRPQALLSSSRAGSGAGMTADRCY